MNKFSDIKKNYTFITIQKLVIVSLVIGLLSAFLAISVKRITEYYQKIFFHQAENHSFYYIVFPFVGLSLIYFLRLYLFNKKENKGIKEIFESTNSKTKNLPAYKIPSHFINGFLTVIFGGSTGIEVSTVVATATIGSVAHQKEGFFKKFKIELIAAGIAAGITALFCSPIAGILFSLEVITKKASREFFLTTMVSVAVTMGLLELLNEPPLFALNVVTWHYHAIPYFILLGILAGMHSVYLTKCVLFCKAQFSKIGVHYYKILLGVAVLSVSLFFLPELYGDGYHAMKNILFAKEEIPLTISYTFILLGLLFLKPIVTSVTLASGGDGGVFAPSLFLGAFLGIFLALVLNTFFDAQVIPLNFMILGMAATLSASIHAPYTSLFLVCGIVNDYTLFLPILLICLVSKYTAKMIYPYNVYTFSANASK